MVSRFNKQHSKMEKQVLKDACSPPPGMVDSILLEAAKTGKTITIKTMLANDANINAKDGNGLTPLMHAVSNDYLDIVEILLNNGANVNEKSNEGRTALMMAKAKKNTKTIILLEKSGSTR